MNEQPQATLVRLGDTELVPASDTEDIRGRPVVDRDGEDIGDVDELLIDERDKRVRLIEVGSGGFLGIGETKRLIPVEAVTSIDDKVHVDTSRDQVSGSPEYDPKLEHAADYFGSLYGHYGYTPFSPAAAYAPPPFPRM